MTPVSKAAQGFFYVRQIAHRLGRGDDEVPGRTFVDIVDVPMLGDCFGSRVDPDLEIRIGSTPSEASIPGRHGESIAFEKGRSNGEVVATVRRGARDASFVPRPIGVRIVAESGLPRFAEVASHYDDGRRVYALLARIGLRAAITGTRDTFVSDDVLDAFVEPIAAFLASGARSSTVAVTLRELGFVDLPRDALASRLPNAPDAFLPTPDTNPPDSTLESAILVSLLGWAFMALEDGRIAHPSIADVIATDLVGFPVGLGGLCRHFSIARARALLAEPAGWSALVDSRRTRAAMEYVERGRPFYRG